MGAQTASFQPGAFPPSVLFIITSRCNLHCKMCAYGYKKGLNLPYPEFEKLAREMKENGVKIVYLSGGEPMLHPNFPEIVHFLKDLGFTVRLSTNGTLLSAERAGELELVDSLSISLDGFETIHDTIRGVPGTFNKALRGIQNVKARYSLLPISISVTVLPENASLIEDLIRFAKDIGVSDIGFQPFVPFFSADSQRPGISQQLAEQTSVIRDVFQQLAGSPENLGNIKEYYRLCQEFCKGNYQKLPPCHAGRSIFVIHPDGSVGPCSGIESTPRTPQETLREVFQSSSYLKTLEWAAAKKCSQCLFYCFYYPSV